MTFGCGRLWEYHMNFSHISTTPHVSIIIFEFLDGPSGGWKSVHVFVLIDISVILEEGCVSVCFCNRRSPVSLPSATLHGVLLQQQSLKWKSRADDITLLYHIMFKCSIDLVKPVL